MGDNIIEFVFCSSVLLLFLTLGHGYYGVDHVLHLHSMDSDNDLEKNPKVNSFAVLKDIEVGKTRPIYFPYIKDPTSFDFFPKELIQNIPFSSKHLPQLLQFFSFSPDSPQASAMEKALQVCENKPSEEGRMISHCVASLESLLDFARRIFGSDYSRFTILRSTLISSSTPALQNYTVTEFGEIVSSGKILPCHYQPYPYALYYCHFDVGSTNKVFMVSLRGENGDRVNSPFLCHMDTSSWAADHISFRFLGFKPGDSEVCHFFPAYDLILVPK